MFDRRTLTEYGLAVGVTLLALLARFALDPFLGDQYPFGMFWVAVAVTTWIGGLGTSLLSVVLGGLAADWFFVTPRQSFVLEGVANHFGLATYFFIAFMIVGFGQAWQRAQQHADVVMEGLRREVIKHKQAEEGLRRSEAQYRAIGESIDYGVWISAPDGRNTYASDSFLKLVGLTQEQCCTIGWDDALHPDDAKGSIAAWKECVRTGSTWDREYRVRGVDGQWHYILTHGVPVKDAQGHILSWAGINLDISSLKRSELGLRDSEARFRTLADNISQLAWMSDATGWLFWYNRRWYEYTGTTFEDMQEWGWNTVHHPNHVDRVVKTWQQAHATGQPWEDTFPLRGGDGTYRWFLSRAVPIRDEAGAVVRWFGTNTDITEMMNVEAALRSSEERYRMLYESIDEGFCVIEVLFDENQTPADYVFLEVNPAFEKQTGLKSARGRRMREIAPEHEQHWFDIYGHVAMTGESRRFEYPAVQLRRWYEGYAYRFGKPHERKVGILFNDITERKASQTRVERFAEELERKISERTLELVASQEQLRALATELNLTEQRERMRLATELHDYLAQMLVLARLKLGQAKQPSTVCSSDFINQADEALSNCLSYTRALVAELSPPVLYEFGLPAALRWLGEQMCRFNLAVTVLIHAAEDIQLPEDQAILLFQSVRELLLNTSKHAKSDHASLVLDQIDGRLRIVVQDDGVGFDPAAMKTFSLSQKFGLFSIRERMRALGGTFDLNSAPEKGTTATLILPFLNIVQPESGAVVNAIRASQPETVQQARKRPAKEGVCRVLIVDDHAVMRQGLRSLLESYADIEVVGEAADGEEAVRIVAELCPSVVIMDINMPKMNGIEATKRITVQFPTVAVIGLSVNAEASIQDVMKKAGAATLLTKVAAVEQLYSAIQHALKLEHTQA